MAVCPEVFEKLGQDPSVSFRKSPKFALSGTIVRDNGSKTVVYIEGQKWYFRLVGSDDRKSRALLEDYSRDQLHGKLLVSQTTPNDQRLFSLFDSYLDFNSYQQKFPVNDRCYYELILGDSYQKPHFDIDVSKDQYGEDFVKIADVVKDMTIQLLISTLKERDVNLDIRRDILVYSSHGENKRSFHIVVRGYCHVNNVEASSLYSLIMKQFPDDLKRYAATIDRSVYSSKQQFRMLGSQKRQSNRPKIFQTIWTYFGNQIQHIYTMKPTSVKWKNYYEWMNRLFRTRRRVI